MSRKILLSVMTGAVAVGLIPAPVLAQAAPAETPGADAGIADIIVTATKTGATAVQKTPIAVSVFSANQLSVSMVNNVKDLVALTPSLNVAQTTSNAQIYIRGIGSNNVFNGSDPDVTVQVDGVYLARPYAQFADFIDVDRIEVLRGPQGTLYGRNAVGGTLNVITRKPSDTFEGKVQLTGGNYDLFQGQAYVSGPIIPGKLQASLTGNYIRHNSYFDNVLPGGRNVGDANHGGLRGQLRFTPSDTVEMITRVDWNKADESFYGFSSLLAPYAAAPIASSLIGHSDSVAINDPHNTYTNKIWGMSQEINIRLGARFTIKSLTAYRYNMTHVFNDSDATELTLNRSTQYDRSRQLSQELDVNYTGDRLRAVAGVYYFREHEDSVLTSDLPPSALTPAARASFSTVSPNAHARSLAGFAQGTYHIDRRLGVTAGIRYTRDKKAVDQTFRTVSQNPATPGVQAFLFTGNTTKTYPAWTPKFGIDYQLTPTILGYASATRGFKSGGTNWAARNTLALNFAPEKIWSYEAGIKSEWFDRRLRINLTAFKYDYKDLQVQALLGSGIISIGNAATAKVKGLEVETEARPLPMLRLTANYTLLDAKYGSFPTASVPSVLQPFLAGDPRLSGRGPTATYNASGNRLNAAPKSSFSGSAEIDHDLGTRKIYLRGEYYWQSRSYYDPSNAFIMSQKPYDLVNLSLGMSDKAHQWGAQITAKNVTNTHYFITIAANGVEPAGFEAAPRTVAIQLTKSW